MGHNDPISGKNLDMLVKKSLELECPDKLANLFKHHRSLMYYPQAKLLTNIIEFYNKKNDYKSMKVVFTSFLRR